MPRKKRQIGEYENVIPVSLVGDKLGVLVTRPHSVGCWVLILVLAAERTQKVMFDENNRLSQVIRS